MIVAHRCPVPGCDWEHKVEPIAVAKAPDLLAAVRQANADTEEVLIRHLRTHFIPEQPGEPPTIHSLTDADGNPAVKFGPDVAAMILVTGSGMCQIIGRENVDPIGLGEAVTNAGRYLLNDGADWANERVPDDAGPRLNRIPTALPHRDYPHEPGRLLDCPACEAACHCDPDPGTVVCVYGGVHHKKGHRIPYVGSGSEGARRSAEIDRTEADTLDRSDDRHAYLLASAARWEQQAADLEAVE